MGSKTMGEVLKFDRTPIRLQKWMNADFLSTPIDEYEATAKDIDSKTTKRIMKATQKLAKKHMQATHILKASDIIESSYEESKSYFWAEIFTVYF